MGLMAISVRGTFGSLDFPKLSLAQVGVEKWVALSMSRMGKRPCAERIMDPTKGEAATESKPEGLASSRNDGGGSPHWHEVVEGDLCIRVAKAAKGYMN